MILQPILDLVSICAAKGIKNAVLSPGSRCAPISLAFIRHPDIHCRTISDERSAAFIALGMAQQLEKPVVMVCTSGSAAYNYAPAVAEAFFQHIPLLVITADRPKEWIDQWDGQTIRQENIYGRHVKQSFNFPDEFSHKDKIWHAHRIVNEAINLTSSQPYGPVHINIPLREPFYPEADEIFEWNKNIPTVDVLKGNPVLTEDGKIQLKTALNRFKRVMIVPGQQRPNEKLKDLLEQLGSSKKAVVVTDCISNMQNDSSIYFHDLLLDAETDTAGLLPDLVISFGNSIISKNLKLFLRNQRIAHWHVRTNGYVPDTYQNLEKHITSSPLEFIKFLKDNLPDPDPTFIKAWSDGNSRIKTKLPAILEEMEFGEWKAINQVLKYIPSTSKLHLANSMMVRYVNFLGIQKPGLEIVCNRGTSGIDGSNSTAVGCTFTTKEPVTLITGDMAFFYDRNAFWHKYSMPNLRIILLNNHAGGIFRLINGPSKLPELEEFFETRQNLDARQLAVEYDFHHYLVEEEDNLVEVLKTFYHQSIHPKILEIKTNSPKNAIILSKVKNQLKSLLQ